MNVKSVFLNGYISEKVYVEQPLRFMDQTMPNHIFKLNKALYGLKQVPRAQYDRLSKFLLENNFTRGSVDKTLFIQRKYNELLIVQIYVDDIIFGATNKNLYKEFTKLMQEEFQISLMDELNYFIGLQVKQTINETFISQTKYIKKIIKKFGMESSKPLSTPISPTCKLNKDEKGTNIDQILYRGIIGSLLYLTASRLDILFSICMCARF